LLDAQVAKPEQLHSCRVISWLGLQPMIASVGDEALSRPVHPSSFDKMAEFMQKYLQARAKEPLRILDLGSQDFNGSYRSLFDRPPWRYVGIDMADGKNVDLVLCDPYRWREIKAESADVIVSGQTFEHTEFFWLTIREIARALKVGGLLCLIAPSAGDEHRYPVDCWRVYPDGLRALARYAGLEVVEAWTQWEDRPEYDIESNKWHDSVLIAHKPTLNWSARWRRKLERFFVR
jgi:SAM-dependent methyltransferase